MPLLIHNEGAIFHPELKHVRAVAVVRTATAIRANSTLTFIRDTEHKSSRSEIFAIYRANGKNILRGARCT